MSFYKPLLLILLLPFFSGSPLLGADAVFQSGKDQNALVELFTSEGCSSCPPADEWLGNLSQSPDLWKKIVPVAFHVDIWDKQGWKDNLASGRFTERLEGYARRWRSGSIYTPTIAVNGIEWGGWSRGQEIPLRAKPVGILKAERSDAQEFNIFFTPVAGVSIGKLTGHAALVGFDIVSRVKDGENKGKTLTHQFAVLSYQEEFMRKSRETYRASVHLRSPEISAKRTAVVFWVTDKDDVIPLQAVGGYYKP